RTGRGRIARHQGWHRRRRPRRGQWPDVRAPERQGDAAGAGRAAGKGRRAEDAVGPRSMRISHFFIDRPIFASVLSIVFVILRAVAFWRLPVAQYPETAPPIINVSVQYPGASSEGVRATA